MTSVIKNYLNRLDARCAGWIKKRQNGREGDKVLKEAFVHLWTIKNRYKTNLLMFLGRYAFDQWVETYGEVLKDEQRIRHQVSLVSFIIRYVFYRAFFITTFFYFLLIVFTILAFGLLGVVFLLSRLWFLIV